MKILALIPARAGSKGVPGKNIADIAGKPLIAHSIGLAKEAANKGILNDVVVTTDGPEIAKISEKFGAWVPFLRPNELSNDTAKSIDFILHAIETLKTDFDKEYDWVLLLQPTSPLRTIEDLEKAIFTIKQNDNAQSLISVYQEDYINDLVMYKLQTENVALTPVNPLHNKGVRRQDHGETYVRNGAIYMTKVEYLSSTRQIISDFPLMLNMPKSRSLNIDTQEDLDMVRKWFIS